MFCSNCGNKCDDNDIFCGHCGHKIMGDEYTFAQPKFSEDDFWGRNEEANTNKQNFGCAAYDSDPTVMINVNDIFPQKQVECFMIYVETNDVIHIGRYPFKIGKDPNRVDFAVPDEPTVSRVHAELVCRDEKVYIIDLNSTNHTFVNGNMIRSGEEVELHDEDQIFISRVPFIFKL